MATQNMDHGDPNWGQAHNFITEIVELPEDAPEAEITVRLYIVLRHLFPNLKYPRIAIERGSGNGPMDISCDRVILEVKGKGKRYATHKYDARDETPDEQLLRYLKGRRTTNTGSNQRPLFPEFVAGWRGVITDGIEWDFYDYDHENLKLVEVKKLRLEWDGDIEHMLRYMHGFVSRATPRNKRPTVRKPPS